MCVAAGWLTSVWLSESGTSAASSLYFIVEGVLFPTPEPTEDVEPELGSFAAVCKGREKGENVIMFYNNNLVHYKLCMKPSDG